MTAAIERYKRRLKRCLHCDSVSKHRLMTKFEGMLTVYLGDSGWPASWPSERDLENAFGTPEQMARILMQEVSEEVLMKYCKAKKILHIAGTIVLMAFLLYLVYVVF